MPDDLTVVERINKGMVNHFSQMRKHVGMSVDDVKMMQDQDSHTILTYQALDRLKGDLKGRRL